MTPREPKYVKIHEAGTNRLVALVAYRVSEDGKSVETGAAFLKRKDSYDFNTGAALARARLNAKDQYYSHFGVNEVVELAEDLTHTSVGQIVKIDTFKQVKFNLLKLAITAFGVQPYDMSRTKQYNV